MPDKCQAHDSCMREIKEDLDEIKDLLRDGKVIHAEHELRIKSIEQVTKGLAAIEDLKGRIARMENSGGWNWKGNFLRLLIGLVEKAIIVIIAMAWWASQNGYGG